MSDGYRSCRAKARHWSVNNILNAAAMTFITKTLKLLAKALHRFVRCLWLLNVQLHVHLKCSSSLLFSFSKSSQQTNVQLELHKLELIGTRIKTRIRIIDLFSCTAASLFNELTYLLTYWNCAFCVELHVRTDRVETGAVWTCLHSVVL